jgi:hypothetical protein
LLEVTLLLGDVKLHATSYRWVSANPS